MGFRFPLHYANIAAYLSWGDAPVPRLRRNDLQNFIAVLQNPENILCSDSTWRQEIDSAAGGATARIPGHDNELTSDEVSNVLQDVRRLLRDFPLFALAVGAPEHERRLRAYFEHAAYASRSSALILMPDDVLIAGSIELLDPFPPIAAVADHVRDLPGFVFWTRDGEAVTFTTLDDADRLVPQLIERLGQSASRQTPAWLIEMLRDFGSSPSSRQLLHLSDLHFGTEQARRNLPYLSAHLNGVVRRVEQVVISGDLFDNPDRSDRAGFDAFRTNLELNSPQSVVVVPGNHDSRRRGNEIFGIGRNLEELAHVEWTSIAVNDAMQTVFFCFDSSRGGDFARGTVGTEQLLEVASQWEIRQARDPRLKDYARVALVHHHPFPFQTGVETLLQRGLRAVGFYDERFLSMTDGPEFVTWCAARGIPLILHGHKHVPRHVRKMITVDRYRWLNVDAVGCGTSLGAEGYPLSYNLLSWSAGQKRWSVCFMHDAGDGSGFTPEAITVSGA